ncbi:MAG: potassium channel family protein [Ktedonobacterales bacterium]|nr:potassium channel family protein [Ktedonobacterales bacterium]
MDGGGVRAAAVRPRVRRQDITSFVERHALAWDLSMGGLALLYILLGYFQDNPRGPLNEATLTPIELIITLAFLAEFSVRFYAAASRRAYLRGHWIDLVALLPAVRVLRFLRFGRLAYLFQAARVLRLGVLVRLLVEIERAGDRIRWIAVRNGLHVVFPLAFGLVFIGGALIWQIEHATNPDFRDFGNAVWWAFATMATVGYGNGPATLGGRVIAGIIMVAGIACFGMITATVTAYFFERVRGHDTLEEEAHQVARQDQLLLMLADIQRRLERIEGQMDGPDLHLSSPQLSSSPAPLSARGEEA